MKPISIELYETCNKQFALVCFSLIFLRVDKLHSLVNSLLWRQDMMDSCTWASIMKKSWLLISWLLFDLLQEALFGDVINLMFWEDERVILLAQMSWFLISNIQLMCWLNTPFKMCYVHIKIDMICFVSFALLKLTAVNFKILIIAECFVGNLK